jgi:flagellar hook-associated protein 1
MGNLLASILATSNSMRAFQEGLSVVQNNVANSSTPGYAKQVQDFRANSFDLSRGLSGGVTATDLIDYRDQYAERSVRLQQQALGDAGARLDSLARIEAAFDISGETGIPGALTKLFQSFSSWSITPNSAAPRQVVLDSAARVARSFNQAAADLTDATAEAGRAIGSSVDEVNSLLTRLRDINMERRGNFQAAGDPGLDADYHAALEQLSEYVDFNVIENQDGQTSILIGGQTVALMGNRIYPLSTEVTNTGTVIRNAQGDDITGQITGGRVHGLIEVRNSTIPGHLSSLNTLASHFADAINGGLSEGVDANGNAPAQNLFSYDGALGAALTLAVESLNPGDLAGALSTAPGGNGNALKLAQFENSRELDEPVARCLTRVPIIRPALFCCSTPEACAPNTLKCPSMKRLCG